VTSDGTIKRLKDDLKSGMRIGRYRIEGPVGRGGMGTVYRTFDETTNRNVALKLLAPGIPVTLRERFLAECEAEANIRHEHVMPVYDRGWLSEERPYFVMELLYQPITLGEIVEHISKGTLGSTHPRLRHWNDLRRLMADVLLPICEGVAVANEEYGVQHRDLKPDNVLIDIRTRRAYLIDFGICRNMDDQKDIGRIVGTPRFLSPEQASGQVDALTDVWGLGALLRYVVTGEPPLAGTSPFTRVEVRSRIEALKKAEAKAHAAREEAKERGFAGRRGQLEDPTLRVQEDLIRDAKDGTYLPLPENTSAGLAAIIRKAMARAPADRYQAASKLTADLATWIKGGSVHALSEAGAGGAAVDLMRRLLNRNTVRVGGALATLLLGTLIGTGLFAQTPPPPDHRQLDAAADLERLEGEVRTLLKAIPGQAAAPLVVGPQLTRLRAELDNVLARLQQLPEDPEREALLEQQAQVETLFAPRRLRFAGFQNTSWKVHDLAGGDFAVKQQDLLLPPGVYAIRSMGRPGINLRLVVPTVPGSGFETRGENLERVIQLGQTALDVPSGMTWIPQAPPASKGGEPAPAFLAGLDLVTNESYSEWLDELPDDERAEHVPPTGFRRAERDQRRFLVVRQTASEPVLGVRPEHARAFAAWRAEIEGMAYQLPSIELWSRMAGVECMEKPGADALFPWRGALPWRSAHRKGNKSVLTETARFYRGSSPHGVRRLFMAPGEIVTAEDGQGFLVMGAGGMLPLKSAVTRGQPLEGAAADHPYGFRLVLLPQ